MKFANLRRILYFLLLSFRGIKLSKYYYNYLEEEKNRIPKSTTEELLIELYDHCNKNVPYYAQMMEKSRIDYHKDPIKFLQQFPILTKDMIRDHFAQLQSKDLNSRKSYQKSSGGSTGEPIIITQDYEYSAKSGAISLLFSKIIGKDLGEDEILLWGSLNDIEKNAKSWKAKLINRITNTTIFNAFQMSPSKINEFINLINRKQPQLITAYSTTLYEVAKFANNKQINVKPQKRIITSAGMLYPFMREMIEQTFKCRVFNRYGTREVGDIACERNGFQGLWVAPWGNYIEIVDDNGKNLPFNQEGDILITSLTNYAMPLIRYKIGDRGYLKQNNEKDNVIFGQVLGDIIGRADETFRTQSGEIIHPGYFLLVLENRNWVNKYQVIQKDYLEILFKIVSFSSNVNQNELDDITSKTKLLMGEDCNCIFEFVDDIKESPSGKYLFLQSEIKD